MHTAPAPKQPQISPCQWLNSVTSCPQWLGYPTRLSLPINLGWSGDSALPEIGSRVHIYMNGFGPAVVRAYFHADGYLGVICQPDEMPDWYQRQAPGITLGHFFGRELEPRRPQPPQQVWQCVPTGQTEEAPTGTAQDWIPDYPPQEEPDDNQDSEEYPEYPGDEQRDE